MPVASVGTNLKFDSSQAKLWAQFNKFMLKRKIANRHSSRKMICYKAGVPATNTAADNPGKVGVFCIDISNSDVYFCTAWTSSSVFTWLKISD